MAAAAASSNDNKKTPYVVGKVSMPTDVRVSIKAGKTQTTSRLVCEIYPTSTVFKPKQTVHVVCADGSDVAVLLTLQTKLFGKWWRCVDTAGFEYDCLSSDFIKTRFEKIKGLLIEEKEDVDVAHLSGDERARLSKGDYVYIDMVPGESYVRVKLDSLIGGDAWWCVDDAGNRHAVHDDDFYRPVCDNKGYVTSDSDDDVKDTKLTSIRSVDDLRKIPWRGPVKYSISCTVRHYNNKGAVLSSHERNPIKGLANTKDDANEYARIDCLNIIGRILSNIPYESLPRPLQLSPFVIPKEDGSCILSGSNPSLASLLGVLNELKKSGKSNRSFHWTISPKYTEMPLPPIAEALRFKPVRKHAAAVSEDVEEPAQKKQKSKPAAAPVVADDDDDDDE